MELIRETVQTVLATGLLAQHDPVSLILIAPPESGKTSIVLAQKTRTAMAISDITGRGIHMICKSRPHIKHFIINDLIAVSSHKPSVSRYAISTLNSMTEEGIQAIVTPENIETFEMSSGKKGIITSITEDVFNDGRMWWSKIGFCTRMVPFSYRLSAPYVCAIKDAIDAGSDKMVNPKPPVLRKAREIAMPASIAAGCRVIADRVSARLGETGIRRLKQFRALTRGHALLQQRLECTDDDLDFLIRLSPHVSFRKSPELK